MSDLHTNGTANRAPTGAQDDIVKRLRTAPPSMLGVRLEAADLIEAQQAEIERLRAEADDLRSWIDRQQPRKSYEATICPICHEATEYRYWSELERHIDGCPWRREACRG